MFCVFSYNIVPTSSMEIVLGNETLYKFCFYISTRSEVFSLGFSVIYMLNYSMRGKHVMRALSPYFQAVRQYWSDCVPQGLLQNLDFKWKYLHFVPILARSNILRKCGKCLREMCHSTRTHFRRARHYCLKCKYEG